MRLLATRRVRQALLAILALGALGLGLLAPFPTRERCRASGRAVDPTGRHCVASDGYVQLREHVLFHTAEVVALGGAALALGLVGRRVARHRASRRRLPGAHPE